MQNVQRQTKNNKEYDIGGVHSYLCGSPDRTVQSETKKKPNSYCTKSHNVQTRMIFDSIYIEIIARDTQSKKYLARYGALQYTL